MSEFDMGIATNKNWITMLLRGAGVDIHWFITFEFKNIGAERADRVSVGLPQEAINQFKALCKRRGLELSDVEATRSAHDLINLVRVVNKQKPILSFLKDKY